MTAVEATSPASAPDSASPAREPVATVRVSVALMCHPKRAAFIPELAAKIDRPLTVVWDTCNDRWDTGRRSMLAYDPTADFHAVIQDDAVVCRDLIAGLEQAIPHVPAGSPLCLYIGTVRPWPVAVKQLVDATKADTSWIVMGALNWGVGIVVPTSSIEEMVAWCDQRKDIANYDKRLSAWFEHKGIPVWYPWPSLVNHRDSPSLVPGRNGGRFAHRFIGADRSALELDWSGGVMEMAALTAGRGRPAPVEFVNVHSGRVRKVPGASVRRFEQSGCWVRVDTAHRCGVCGQVSAG